MDLTCDERPSDSALIERIWRSESDRAGNFISIGESHGELVVSHYEGKTTITVRGPETKATAAYCPAGAQFVGIVFKRGTFMPHFPPGMVMDRHDVDLPDASGQSFWLNGSAWQFPTFENADTFVDWLVRDGLLVHDPLVDAVLSGQPAHLSQRTVQRRVLQATGLTQGAIFQIDRARYATILLKQGMSILDVVEQAGYFDQPHLTRSLRQFIGQTPAQIADLNRTERLSFLYNTGSPALSYDAGISPVMTKGA